MSTTLTHPKLRQSSNPVTLPKVVYRGDSRSPAEIMESGGFISQGTNYDVFVEHMLGKVGDAHQSGYISTSTGYNVAQTFAAPIGRSEYKPGSWCPWEYPRRESEGWVYEIEPTGNFISFENEARTEYHERMTSATKEWVAVRKINADKIIRATKYKRAFPVDREGCVTVAEPPFEKVEDWENSEGYSETAPGYDPYEDPTSGWSDQVTLLSDLNQHPQHGTAENEAVFDHALPRACPETTTRNSRALSTESLCGIVDWDGVKERSKETVKEVVTDAEHMDQIPARKVGGLSHEETLKVVEPTKARIMARNGARIVAGTAGVALWAANMAQTFKDHNSTTLDKVTVTLSLVPGIGQALGIADGINHHDAETVAVNAISLAALVASQAIPVVGEIVDTVLLADMLVETVSGLFPHFRTGPPVTLPTGAIPDMPILKASSTCTFWHGKMDITWEQPTVEIPQETRVVVKERANEREYTYAVSDGKSPGWDRPADILLPVIPIPIPVPGLSTRIFDLFLRLEREWGTFQSKKRTVVRTEMLPYYCNTTTWEEDW